MSQRGTRPTPPTSRQQPSRGSQQQDAGPLANTYGRDRDALLRDSISRITDAKKGWEYLEVKVLDTRGEKPSAAQLEVALLIISHLPNVPLSAVDGIRAVALCLKAAVNEATNKEAAETVREAVREEVLNSVTELVESVRSMTDNTIETVRRMAEDAREVDTERRAAAPAPTAGHNNNGGGPITYADVLRANAGPLAFDARHQEVVDRSDTREKQVLIDPVEGEEAGGIKELTTDVLMEKARQALDNMGLYGSDKPPGTAFHSVKKLPNGGAVYEMSTVEGAQWLRQPDVRRVFMEKYGVLAQFKDRTYPVLAEFAPTTIPDVPINAVSIIEGTNDIVSGEITRAKWIKAPNHRKPGQMSAHLILGFSSREGANRAIDKGLLLDGKKVKVKKLDPEPRRCLKCQFLGKGHVASECKQIHETCGLCAGQHRTSACTADLTAHKCVNCRDKGRRHDHPSSDRLCPTFHEYRARILDRQPELRYKYYITGDPTTWIRRDDGAFTQGVGAPAQGGGLGNGTQGAAHIGGAGPQGQGEGRGVGVAGGGWNGWERGVGRGRLAGGQPGEGGGVRRSQTVSRAGRPSRSRSRPNTPAHNTQTDVRHWLLSSSSRQTQSTQPPASQPNNSDTWTYISGQRSRAMNAGSGSWGDDQQGDST